MKPLGILKVPQGKNEQWFFLKIFLQFLGKREGRREGENLIILLTKELLRTGRMDDLNKMLSDKSYRKKLKEELNAGMLIKG